MMDEKAIVSKTRMCAACPKMCRHVCPTFLAWRSDAPTPHGRSLLVYQDMKGIRQLDERSIEVLYQCLECSHCLTWCLPEVDVASIVESVRTKLVNDSRAPRQIQDLQQAVTKFHNPFGEPHSDRTRWFKPSQSASSSIIYFAGCTSSYREKSIAESTVSVLSDVLGHTIKVSDDEWCCGSPLFRTGSLESGLEAAGHNTDLLNSMDGAMIVTSCPGCYRALTKDYPSHGLTIRKPVVHISQLLWANVGLLPKMPGHASVTYHDPCHLGRHCGVYDEPRGVLNHITGDHLVEMERTRENAMCCGNGAGLRAMFPEKSQVIGRERIGQARQAGAQYLITSCPFCKNLLNSVAESPDYVMDLPEFVLKAVRGFDSSPRP